MMNKYPVLDTFCAHCNMARKKVVSEKDILPHTKKLSFSLLSRSRAVLYYLPHKDFTGRERKRILQQKSTKWWWFLIFSLFTDSSRNQDGLSSDFAIIVMLWTQVWLTTWHRVKKWNVCVSVCRLQLNLYLILHFYGHKSVFNDTFIKKSLSLHHLVVPANV